MKNLVWLAAAIGILLMGCTTPSSQPQPPGAEAMAQTENNPFFVPYPTPEQVPPFDTIREEHLLPAFNEGMRLHGEEIAAIAHNHEVPTFSNTVEALEASGKFLNRVESVFNTLTATSSNDRLDKLSETIAPRLTQHYNKILLNPVLFARVQAVDAQKSKLHLSRDQEKLLSDQMRQFVRNGAKLGPKDKAEVEIINQRISVLMENFNKNVRKDAERYQLVLSDPAQLAGLPAEVIAEARAEAERAGLAKKWLFTIQRSSITPFLTYSSRRELRQQIYQAYQQCGNNNNEFDNKKIIVELVSLRHRLANLLGFPTYAAYSLENSMAKTTDHVYGLLDKMWPSALQQVEVESRELQTLIARDGQAFNLEGWDWHYYAEKLRKQKYELDETMLRPYFSLPATIDGAFYLAQRLYGLRFVERHDLPTYHKEVRTFSVFDKKNKLIGLYYIDPFRRAGKRAGAWMDSLRLQSVENGKAVLPIVINVLNFNPPAGRDGVALLSLTEANTVLHEFGHALHGLLSSVRYASQSGTNVPRDFVEFPSQVMENWLLEPSFLQVFAKHYQTGTVIPKALISKIQRSRHFNRGFEVTEYMAAAYLDLAWHTTDPARIVGVEQFEQEVFTRLGLPTTIATRYHSGFFLHIFASGYAAGYYSYQWSQILDADTFALFKKRGIFNPAVAEKFRKEILAKGGSAEADELFRAFIGRNPEITALQERLGFPKGKASHQ